MVMENNGLGLKARLEVFNGVLAGKVLPMEDDAVIGRQDENIPLSKSPDISLPDSRVSRRHARIFVKGGQYFLEDLSSTNGTFLNACNVAQREPVMPRKGSNVQMGETHMRFFPAFKEETVNEDKNASSPWQSEIGLNEEVFDFSKPARPTDDT